MILGKLKAGKNSAQHKALLKKQDMAEKRAQEEKLLLEKQLKTTRQEVINSYALLSESKIENQKILDKLAAENNSLKQDIRELRESKTWESSYVLSKGNDINITFERNDYVDQTEWDRQGELSPRSIRTDLNN